MRHRRTTNARASQTQITTNTNKASSTTCQARASTSTTAKDKSTMLKTQSTLKQRKEKTHRVATMGSITLKLKSYLPP
jgi:hypothetical protein